VMKVKGVWRAGSDGGMVWQDHGTWVANYPGGFMNDPYAFPELSRLGGAQGGGAAATQGPYARRQGPPGARRQEDFPALPRATGEGGGGGAGPSEPPEAQARPPPPKASSTAPSATPPRVIPRDATQDPLLVRNRRFAEALGISETLETVSKAAVVSAAPSVPEPLAPYQLELLKPVYPRELLHWANLNRGEVLRLERKIEHFFTEGKTYTLNLKPMPREDRRLVGVLDDMDAAPSH
jgi:hypothetical protein